MADLTIRGIVTAEDKASKVVKDVANSFGKLTQAVALGDLTASALKSTMNQLGNVLKTGVKFEQFRVSFATMMGSVGQGNLMLKNLYDFAASTPFEIEPVVNASRKLMAMGVAATDVVTTLKTLGDISATVGTEKLPQLILAYGQVTTATKLTGMELRQFTEAGVPLLQELSNVTGKSTSEIKYGMEHGITVPANIVRQALDNMTKEGGVAFNMMQKQSKTLGGAWSNLKDSFTLMSAKIGEFASTTLAPVIGRIAEFVKNNGSMIISLVTAAIAVVALTGVVYAVAQAINYFKIVAAAASISTMALSIPLLLIAALLGVVVYKAMQNFQNKMKTVTDSVLKNTKAIGNGAEEDLGGKAAKAAEDLAEKLADIDEQIIKSNKTFTENLAQIVKTTQDKIKELNSSIAEETSAYNKENAIKLADFTKSQTDMTTEHQKKVDEIQKQIDEEVGYGWLADQQKLADLQAQLAEENTEYDTQFAENKLKYEQDTLTAKTEHDKKMLDFQTRLQAETDLLTQHSADVLSVKDFQYKDEIQKLKDSHAEELIEFDKQKEKARKAAADQGSTMMQAQIDATKAVAAANTGFLDTIGADIGSSLGTALKDSVMAAVREVPGLLMSFFKKHWAEISVDVLGAVLGGIAGGPLGAAAGASLGSLLFSSVDYLSKYGLANGTNYASGGPTLVGEKGPEIVNMPRGAQVIPNNQLGNLGNNLTVNIYGNINNQQGFSPEEIGQIINRQIILSQQGAF